MKKKLGASAAFVFSLLALLISLKLFWNMGIYVDEANTTPVEVYGGVFWLGMDWLRLALLSAIAALSGITLFQKQD